MCKMTGQAVDATHSLSIFTAQRRVRELRGEVGDDMFLWENDEDSRLRRGRVLMPIDLWKKSSLWRAQMRQDMSSRVGQPGKEGCY